MDAPKVAVLVPVLNGERYLRATIESILGQTFRNFELIVLDDASTDDTPGILASFSDPRLRVIRNERNSGQGPCMNIGMAATRAPYIARNDGDDLSHPRRLELQVAFLDRHPAVAIVGSSARVIDEEGRVRHGDVLWKAQNHRAIEWQLMFGSPFVHSSVMFRRDVVFDRMGGYVNMLAEDFEMFSRLLIDFEGRNLPDYLVDYRTHDQSVSGLRGDKVIESRRHHLLKVMELQRQNVERVLRTTDLAAEWAEVWGRITASWVMGPPPRAERVLSLMPRVERRFRELYPESAADPDIVRQSHEALMQLSRLLVPIHRGAALRSFVRSLRLDPVRSATRGWRILPFLLAGERGVRRMRAITAPAKALR